MTNSKTSRHPTYITRHSSNCWKCECDFVVRFRISLNTSEKWLCEISHNQAHKHLHVIYIYTFQRDTQRCSTDCLLMHRCQLYTFRTVTVHPQELLFRCCMCRLWYVVRNALSDMSRWYNVWGRSSSSNVVPTGCIRWCGSYDIPQSAHTASKKKLLRMGRYGPKRVELTPMHQ